MSIVPFPHYIPTAKVRSNLLETIRHRMSRVRPAVTGLPQESM